MKAKELRSLNVADLKKKKAELSVDLMKEYAQVATGTIPKNPGRIRKSRKTIARISMVLAEKEAPKKA